MHVPKAKDNHLTWNPKIKLNCSFSCLKRNGQLFIIFPNKKENLKSNTKT